MDRRALGLGLLLCAVMVFTAGCGDDDDDDTRDAGTDSGAADGGGRSGSGGKGGRSGGSGGSGGQASEAGSGGSGDASSMVARGDYLVNALGACNDCHTPRNPDGSFDFSRRLSGVDCFFEADATNPDFGCLSARNLTNHETGLKNRSEREIKDMFLKGIRPADSGGQPTALHPLMPYWALANMNDADADAIVAYLRTVEPIDHRTKPRQAPFQVDAPAPAFPESKIPEPRTDYPDHAAALRGKYLAGNVGVCLECHTPRDAMGGVLVDQAFQGGREFNRADLGLPPIFPEKIYASNLTPDPTGIGGWTVGQIVKALKQGTDTDNTVLCPPMPSGPMGPFGDLTDDDAADIGHYLLSLAPVDHVLPGDCVAMPPPVDLDGGADDAG